MGLYRANGARVTESNIVKITDPDPIVIINEDLYERKPYSATDADPNGGQLTLFCKAGKPIRTSALALLFPDPVIDTLLPATSVLVGQTTHTVTGKFLDGVSAVTVGGTNAVSFKVVSPTKLTFVAPAKTAGAYPVVITDDGGSATKTAAITYS